LPQNSPYWEEGWLCNIGDLFSTSNHKILYLTCMFACPPNLKDSILTICEIVMFKVDGKVFFAYAREGQQSFGGQKNHFLKQIWTEPPWIPTYRWIRYMSTKSHIHRRCGTWRKNSISKRGYAEIRIQRPVFDNKKSIWKIIFWEIRTVSTYFDASQAHCNFFPSHPPKSHSLILIRSSTVPLS
jgi:hypothetical protein